MSGNFRCDSCLSMFAALSPVRHEWLCSGCVSKAAGEREAGTQYRQGRAETPTPPGLAPAGSAETSTVSPVAAEASEYGWPKKGETFIVAACGLCAAAHDFAPGQASRGYDMPPDGVTWAMWDGACRRGYNDPYRRINSPSAGPRDSAEQAEPDPRASRLSDLSEPSESGSSGVGQGEMSDAAIWDRCPEWDMETASEAQYRSQFAAFVRAEVERATKEMLTREQVDQAWDDAGLARTFQHAKFMGCIDATLRGDP